MESKYPAKLSREEFEKQKQESVAKGRPKGDLPATYEEYSEAWSKDAPLLDWLKQGASEVLASSPEEKKAPPPAQGNSEQYTEELRKLDERGRPKPNSRPAGSPPPLEPISSGYQPTDEEELDENGQPRKLNRNLLGKLRMPT